MAGVDILVTAFNGANAAFIADLYARWVANPNSVDPSFGDLFAALNDEAARCWRMRPARPGRRGISRSATPEPPKPAAKKDAKAAPAAANGLAPEQVRAATLDSLRALMLIRAYRVRGHLEAQLDPLGLTVPKPHAELDPATYGFTAADMDRPVFIDNVIGRETATMREIVALLRQTYCGPIGIEYMHIQDPTQKAWLQRRVEGAPWATTVTKEEKKTLLQQLTEAEGFETFCQKRYVGTKRFGLEGGEVTIPALHAMIDTAARAGVNEVVIGMPHRGRLNTLVNVVRKPFTAIFSEFGGNSFKPDDVQGSGDVKYHLGTSTDIEAAGHPVHISLQPNPSHLEAVDPVVVGKVRARQDNTGDTKTRRNVIGILMHGDAAFAGQGLVYETLAMSQLIGYRTGGTIHLVVNNQIGFTTRAGACLFRPVLHGRRQVDPGADPARERRQSRGGAVLRPPGDRVPQRVRHRLRDRRGLLPPPWPQRDGRAGLHQPIMYRAIRDQKTTRTLYAEKLAAEGSVTADDAKAMWDGFTATLEEAYKAAQSYKPNKADWLEGQWSGLTPPDQEDEHGEVVTALSGRGPEADRPRAVHRAGRVRREPEDRPPARSQARHDREGRGHRLGDRRGAGLRRPAAGRPPRAPVRRGLPARHLQPAPRGAGGPDQPERIRAAEQHPRGPGADRHLQLAAVRTGRAGLRIRLQPGRPDDPGAVGGQFGDFANGAQVIIDQFLASGETKWLRMSGLTLLLPHGYEGQGPEHSSARLERYLQLCAERNMVVCNLTTPANYFHALRRQLKWSFRKPLIIMTPKSLLRHKLAGLRAGRFRRRLGLQARDPRDRRDRPGGQGQARRAVHRQGLLRPAGRAAGEGRPGRGDRPAGTDLPVPAEVPDGRAEAVSECRHRLVQEEPENMGAWNFVDRKIERMLGNMKHVCARPEYVGRDAAASPATGLAKIHTAQQAALVARALGLD